MSEKPSENLVLYRCPTPTNVLCPCGAVARRLRRLELTYRTERVPYRRARRPEIEELTRQDRVPLLVDGDEVIHDSKRIVQYLEWKYGRDAGAGDEVAVPAADPQSGSEAEEGEGVASRPGLYNVKRWRLRRRQSS